MKSMVKGRFAAISAIVGVVAIGGAVYLLGGSPGDDDDPGAAEARARPASECSKPAAKDAIADSKFEAAVRELGVVEDDEPLFGGSGYLVTDVFCRDLTADGAEEMVARLDCCAGNAPTPWAILTADAGGWRPVFYRTGVQASLSVGDGAVIERSPAYAAGDPTCCPTAGRNSRIGWNGSTFTVRSADASQSRRIRVGTGGVTQLGGFRPRSESPVEAADELGTPSYVGPNGEGCVIEWRDLGLRVTFASLSGASACSSAGRVDGVELADEQAAQAGWETNRGVRVGMPVEKLRRLYPDAESESLPGLGEALVLVEGRSLVGLPRPAPALSATVVDGAVNELRMSVNAAGG
jgi:hypothetical protein